MRSIFVGLIQDPIRAVGLRREMDLKGGHAYELAHREMSTV